MTEVDIYWTRAVVSEASCAQSRLDSLVVSIREYSRTDGRYLQSTFLPVLLARHRS